MENRHIAFSPPDITEEEIAEVVDAAEKWLDHNWTEDKAI